MRSLFKTVAVLALCVVASACCCPSEEEIEASRLKRVAEREEHLASVEKYRKKLAKLSKAVPAGDALKQKACPDDKIAAKIKATPGFTGRMSRIDSAKLAWISEKDPKGNRAKIDQWNYLNDGFSALDDVAAIGDDNYRAEEAAKAVTKLESEPYIAVIVRGEGELPVVNDDDSFTGGYLDAWVVVFDNEKAKPVCQAAFSVESSNVVEFREGKIVSDEYKFKEAVKDDFEDNTDDAAKAAMNKISKRLKVSWGIF